MRVLVVGSGGREHAIVWKLAQSPIVKEIYCAPGNAGTSEIANAVAINADDIEALLSFVKEKAIDLTVVGPEIPLINGIVDTFNAAGLNIIGPNKDAAQLEGSKVFCKNILKKYNIPTAQFESFSDAASAKSYIKQVGAPIVVKADGAAAGKGVTVAMTVEEALDAVNKMMEEKIFGEAGNNIVIEEFLQGEETSILAFCDGITILPMASAQDHKRIFDNDEGPNTGGMGAYSPVPIVTSELESEIQETILKPTIDALRKEGILFRGILFAGLMLTKDGPKVIEYNVRFGDPETQVVLPRMKNDLAEVFNAIIENKLADIKLSWDTKFSVGVVMAAQGYPENYAKGMKVYGLDTFKNIQDTFAFHAGTEIKNGNVVTNGGRVFNIVALASTLDKAIDKVYSDILNISFAGAYYRRDIGAKGLK
ncbi:MAG: phosphoribosylamine--glycine ligase [Candidatus Margulisiibacteriota bacterium]|nr:MAG: phosphoribosylamine--glycine ligase [Candidatus Margulisbacteria bacterium GWD2_39_127]OGI02947.1 MAG: phosphoribosylamine--glycine ligase [Candidatus Margulisbacteria bacterium GWF2_38_17]OGI09460.1 MAG: phosphoribosylamine--glycine ligase [Candidatus Margulisbacteria bacterium GWE2_39_32]PZM78740.1 MAG: phosphoribosylamine--glycine ligase [Candidatus Margulisiibacteriota bacterium]HAR63358.1 phosphoribosylamine--glycine ligase [Candidatus Margulisiibacteriota bacterium]